MQVIWLVSVAAIIGSVTASDGQSLHKTVGFGDTVAVVNTQKVDGVEIATNKAALFRRMYLVDKIELQGYSKLYRDKGNGPFCTDNIGYKDHTGVEMSVCLEDIDGDGSFDELSGPDIPRPVKLKEKIPFSVETGSRYVPLPIEQRIIYLGGDDHVARFSYREFSRSGTARPAFTEDLSIPIKAYPATITIKGVKLVVHSQTSDGLEVSSAS